MHSASTYGRSKIWGFRLINKPFESDPSLPARIKRRLFPRAFVNTVPDAFVDVLRRELAARPPTVIFFNRVNAAPVATQLRQSGFSIPFVLLSHGLMIADEIHFRTEEDKVAIPTRAWRRWWLGDILLKEKSQRKAFDLVFTLTEEERAIERWLGSRRAE